MENHAKLAELTGKRWLVIGAAGYSAEALHADLADANGIVDAAAADGHFSPPLSNSANVAAG